MLKALKEYYITISIVIVFLFIVFIIYYILYSSSRSQFQETYYKIDFRQNIYHIRMKLTNNKYFIPDSHYIFDNLINELNKLI